MSWSVTPEEPHPILGCAAVIDRALDEVAALDPMFMGVTAQREALLLLDRLTSRVTVLQTRVMAASGEVAAAEGHRDVASWMTHRTRRDRDHHRRLQRLALDCDERWRDLGAALQTGAVNTDQGHVIARALGDLDRVLADLAADARVAPPVTPDKRAEVLALAQAHLLEQAAVFGPRELARLGARILHVIAPHLDEDAEGRRLADQDRHARRVTSLSTRDLGDGTTLVKARVPAHVATRLVTTLEAFTNPRGTAGDATGESVPCDLRLGHAFCSLLEGLDPSRLPLHGGAATQLVITIDLSDLLKGLGVGTLAGGETISAAQARRLACTADLVPAVLGTKSEPLDLGRTARLFSPAQRKALALRDQQCRADGCTIPATWCEAHHLVPWSREGASDLDNALLLCSFHHHRIHDDRYLHQRLPNGDVRYSRRR
ncbi:HNH endonuclease signature motif containing protein [Nocardioides sp. 616]|uniref:HNH endonuclease signature motif containing protein n=1 Tax=Nocardioides sp. 616 TaxID=2268090 RepID=UPI000CE449E1|nr:HNH endonuclease signature motif containing protein [Nocardioides sp. 616]